MPGYQTGSEMLGGVAQTANDIGPDSNPNGPGAALLAGSLEDEEA